MARISHGAPLPVSTALEVINVLSSQVADEQADLAQELVTTLLAVTANLQAFDFLFPDLQADPGNLLPAPPEASDTPTKLAELGRTMIDPNDLGQSADSKIPAVFTYLGQFIDHDITFEVGTPKAADMVGKPNLEPLSLTDIKANVKNARTGPLDLDSVYNPDPTLVPMVGDKMEIGTVFHVSTKLEDGCTKPTCRPKRSEDDDAQDLPRKPANPLDPLTDREAKIGDPRNDENLIISQLHVAFLRAHNAIVDMGEDFVGAQKMLRQHYQHIVLHDFLPRIADRAIVDNLLAENKVYDPADDAFFLPLEFAFAAYRFGHTMIRDDYNFNLNFKRVGAPFRATLDLLFTFTALSGQLGDSPTLPDNWIIEWERIIDLGPCRRSDFARRLDTKLADPGLFTLRNETGTVFPADEAILPVRNLLRGYLLRLPTGQAVATKLGITPLTPAQIIGVAASPAQVTALTNGGFLERTPLWYYILAEAAHHKKGRKLGPVGSTLVAAVLIGLVERSQDSILKDSTWSGPTLPSTEPGTFTLTDLLRLAGVLGDTTGCRYTVVAGDSLSSIALVFYGDGSLWPRIFEANKDQIDDPDLIFPGQELCIPPTDHYTVAAGDSLSSIALVFYGDGSLWPRIFEANKDQIDDPDLIFPGQELCIP